MILPDSTLELTHYYIKNTLLPGNIQVWSKSVFFVDSQDGKTAFPSCRLTIWQPSKRPLATEKRNTPFLEKTGKSVFRFSSPDRCL